MNGSGRGSEADSEFASGARPALGLAWASVVGTRIVMYRDETVDNAASYCKVCIKTASEASSSSEINTSVSV